MYSLARHANPTNHKQAHHGMELKHRAFRPHPQWQVLQNPALADPICHERRDRERGGDGRAFEVLGFAGGILGDIGDGDVEAC